VVAEDGGEAAVGFVGGRAAEEFAEFRAGVDFQEGAEVDVAEDVVFDEDTAQGDFFGEDGLGDFGGDVVKIEADDAELDDFFGTLFEEDDFAAVNAVIAARSEDSHIDSGVMEGLHRERHVIVVGEKRPVGFGSGRRRDMLGFVDQISTREEIE